MQGDLKFKLVATSSFAIIAAISLSIVSIAAFPAANTSGIVNQCGFNTSCSTYNPSGLVFTLSVNTTSVTSNSSFSFSITEVNPTNQEVNLSALNNWYIGGLNWPCNRGATPYGIAAFRGYYTLENLSSAINVLRPPTYYCVYSTVPSSFTFLPQSTFIPGFLIGDTQIYAIDGGLVESGNNHLLQSVWSLGSSATSVYTVVAGDEWGDFVTLYLSVLNGTSTSR